MVSIQQGGQNPEKAVRTAFFHVCLTATVRSILVSVIWGLVGVGGAIAKNLPLPLSDLDRFPLFLPAAQGQLVAASGRLSLTEISQPSLSWIEDQLGSRYGSDRLVQQWQAYQTADGFQYVDVIVNESIWDLLNYFERYGFVLQFGTAAKSYGYNLRVFHSGDVVNRQEVIGFNSVSRNIASRSIALRGAYLCDFSDFTSRANALSAEIPCSIVLDEFSSRRPIRRVF